MHFQYPPAAETKLVRCTRGAILDIIVDLRPESPTYLQHISVELNEDNQRALYVPERFAHGYQALARQHRHELPGRRVLHAERRGRAAATTTRASGSSWPLPVTVISDKDQQFAPLLDEIEPELKHEWRIS